MSVVCQLKYDVDTVGNVVLTVVLFDVVVVFVVDVVVVRGVVVVLTMIARGYDPGVNGDRP